MSKDTILSLASAYKDQLEENVTYYKLELENQSKFYQTEAFSWASTILGQIRAKVSKLECRIVATFWLFGLVCTMPMMSFLALGECNCIARLRDCCVARLRDCEMLILKISAT
jgi:hypothetical protein